MEFFHVLRRACPTPPPPDPNQQAGKSWIINTKECEQWKVACW